jgi:hypothetical protein
MFLNNLPLIFFFTLTFGHFILSEEADKENPDDCFPKQWMTMEEILFASDVVLWGKDTDHAKLRHQHALDSRFEVYCVLKGNNFKVPSEVIIEDIDARKPCSAVSLQTEVGQEYIIGLTLMTSGFMTYADVSKMHKSAFPPTSDNFGRLIKTCELSTWKQTEKASVNRCPVMNFTDTCTSLTTTPVPFTTEGPSFFDLLFGGFASGAIRETSSFVTTLGACIFVSYVIKIV